MVFAFGCTKTWYKYLTVNIYSLLKTNPSTKKIYLLLETENIEDVPYLKELQDDFNVEFVLIDFNKIKGNYITDSNPNIDTPYTDFAFCKIILPDVIEEDRVIYLDMDTIVVKDMSRLWYWDMGDNIVAGCRDSVYFSHYFRDELKIDNKGKYINTGVLLMDTNGFKKDKMVKKIFDILNSRELKFPDQDALNIACQGKILYIPSLYNQASGVTYPVATPDGAKVWHMAREKTDWIANTPYSETWYEAEEEFFFKYVHKK